MEIDRNALNKLLKLNDAQLKAVIRNLAANSGIDPKEFNINVSDVASIRNAFNTVSDDDLKQIAQTYEANKRDRR